MTKLLLRAFSVSSTAPLLPVTDTSNLPIQPYAILGKHKSQIIKVSVKWLPWQRIITAFSPDNKLVQPSTEPAFFFYFHSSLPQKWPAPC